MDTEIKLQRKDDEDWYDWLTYFDIDDANTDLDFRQRTYPRIKWRIQTKKIECPKKK